MYSWKLKMVYWNLRQQKMTLHQLDPTSYHSWPLDASVGGTSDLRSTGHNLVPLLATRCLYWGVHLTKGQPDPKDDQMPSWPDVVLLLGIRCLYLGSTSELRSTGHNLVPLLATRCLYQGWVCMSDQRSAWSKGRPNVKLTWCSNMFGHQMPLPWGYIWPKVSLAQRYDKNVNLTQSLIYGGSIQLKCKKDIWKFEHTLGVRSCFTEVFSTKDQK